MKHYPKFLRKVPSVFGLEWSDLLVLMGVLFGATLFNPPPHLTLFVALILVGALKLIRVYVDFTSLFLPRREEILIPWNEQKWRRYESNDSSL